MPNQVGLVGHLDKQGIGPSATKYVATVGIPSVWQVRMTRHAISPRLAKTLSKGRSEKEETWRRTAVVQVVCQQNLVLFLSSLSLLLFAAIPATVRIFRIDSLRCTRGIASIHPLQPEMDAI
jgi:hypothetical protein